MSQKKFLSVGSKELMTYGHFQDFVEHDIWRDVEVKHKVLEETTV